ncbi:hypothetical protein DFH09DRAFT_586397 [Mycena vulgaris]|nr:hypothetical protein DFH09DRAFT_586397 [Mycena vulgaris]
MASSGASSSSSPSSTPEYMRDLVYTSASTPFLPEKQGRPFRVITPALHQQKRKRDLLDAGAEQAHSYPAGEMSQFRVVVRPPLVPTSPASSFGPSGKLKAKPVCLSLRIYIYSSAFGGNLAICWTLLKDAVNSGAHRPPGLLREGLLLPTAPLAVCRSWPLPRACSNSQQGHTSLWASGERQGGVSRTFLLSREMLHDIAEGGRLCVTWLRIIERVEEATTVQPPTATPFVLFLIFLPFHVPRRTNDLNI